MSRAMPWRLLLVQQPNHQWHLRLKSSNGEIVMTSEAYTRQGDAVRAAGRSRAHLRRRLVRLQDRPGGDVQGDGMTERWLPIAGHLGYEVSDLGRVRSIDRVIIRGNGAPQTCHGRIRRPGLNRNGYFYVPLAHGKPEYVHRLVAEAFLSGDITLTVNHLDGVKKNNRLENLELVTQGVNNKHAYDVLGKRHGWSKSVLVNGARFPSLNQAAIFLNSSAGHLGEVIRAGRSFRGMEVRLG